MNAFSFWTVASLIVSGFGLSSISTQAFMHAADGLSQAGLIGEKSMLKSLPPPEPLPIVPVSNVQKTVSIAEPPPQMQLLPSLPALLSSDNAQSVDITKRMDLLSEQVASVWGEDQVVLPSETTVVKYSADLRSRSMIDLKEGKLIVETLRDATSSVKIKQALTQALLTPDDPSQVDVFSTEPNPVGTKPFLLGQIVDSLGKPIDNAERANKFATWAIANRSQLLNTPAGKVQRIELLLDANHKQVRAARFAAQLEAAAIQYGIDLNLLYAITETESHFNPFAVSYSGALGLMQLVPSKAGRDAMQAAMGQNRNPTKDELMNPDTNIHLGAAYVAMLGSRYLGGIKLSQSREYAVIAAYNGGSGRVLTIFGENRAQAFAQINQLTPQIIYDTLKMQHSSSETRGYVEKVTAAKKRYSTRV